MERLEKELMWKLEKTTMGEILSQIERLKSLIGLALANDLFSLAQASKIDLKLVSTDISDTSP